MARLWYCFLRTKKKKNQVIIIIISNWFLLFDVPVPAVAVWQVVVAEARPVQALPHYTLQYQKKKKESAVNKQ